MKNSECLRHLLNFISEWRTNDIVDNIIKEECIGAIVVACSKAFEGEHEDTIKRKFHLLGLTDE